MRFVLQPWLTTICGLMLATTSAARHRLFDATLFMQDMPAGRVEFEGQGKHFALEADTTRLESAIGFRYGLSDHFSFEFSFPFLMESRGRFSKSGQGDLVTALTYHRPVSRSSGINIGIREALIFPSGFRKELAGFESYTAGRTQSETLIQLETGDRPGQLSALWLALNGGLRTDNHLENTRLLWGASIRYHMVRRWIFFESELAQEMNTGNKAATYQFSAGAGVNLPLGFLLRLGAEERVLHDLDRFGLYASLSWSRQPSIPVRIISRHLRPSLQQRLDAKNRVPSYTLEPGTPTLLAEMGRLPFLPLRVVVLPFAEFNTSPVAEALAVAFRQSIEKDSSFQVVSNEELCAALAQHRLTPKLINTDSSVNLLGRALNADLVLRGRVLDFDPRGLHGPLFAPWFANSRQASRISALVWMHQVDHQGTPASAELDTEVVGENRWHFFPVTHGHREVPGSAVERNGLTLDLLRKWCTSASDALMYEETEKIVVDN